MENLNKCDIHKKVRLVTPDDVKRFVWATSRCKGDVDCIEANRNVSGKSVLGIFSLNLSEPVEFVFHDCYGEEDFFNDIKEWVVDE